MSQFPTSAENVAIDIIFQLMGESRINRTYEEYMAIKNRLPPLKILHFDINRRLREIVATSKAPYKICHFKSGDQYIWYEEYPTSVSIETVRLALAKIGMRQPRYRRLPQITKARPLTKVAKPARRRESKS